MAGEVTKLEVEDGNAILTVDSPPVNALGAAVRRGPLDLADPPPHRPCGKAVLLGARHLAGVAADARVHREPEAVLLTGVEGEELGPLEAERPGCSVRRWITVMSSSAVK